MLRKVYLDNGSTSFPKAPGVGKTMEEFITHVGCNVGRGGYETSYAVADRISETRESLCALFGFTDERYVIFTPSVTYSLNFVIKGLLQAGNHVIYSGMEHNAVARPCEDLRQKGVEITAAPCDREGRLDLDGFQACFRPNTRLVVMSHASNVCGTLQDIEAIGGICREKGVFFVLDAAQTAGVVPIDFYRAHLSGLCVTGHKGLLGPQGIGALLLSEELAKALTPVISGGTGSASHLLTMPDFFPDRLEAGTLNLPGILGLRTALRYVRETGTETILERELNLAMLFIEELGEIDAGQKHFRVVGPMNRQRRVGIVSLDMRMMDNAELAYRLDAEYGIMTRCGLHCAPLAHQTLGTFPRGTVRFAFGHKNTEEEVIYTAAAIKAIAAIE